MTYNTPGGYVDNLLKIMLDPLIVAFCTSSENASKVESLSDDVLAVTTSLPHNGSSVRMTSDSSTASQS